MIQFDNATIEVLATDFENIAFRLFRDGKGLGGSAGVKDRRMRAWVGCSATVVAKAWHLLCEGEPLPRGATKERFLWALMLLKSYDTEENNASRVGGVDEGTFRSWSWWFIDELSYLEDEVVSAGLL